MLIQTMSRKTAVLLKSEIVEEMRTADAAVYHLAQTSMVGAFIDFPIAQGRRSHTWVGYWSSRRALESAASPSMRVMTAPRDDAAELRRRVGLSEPESWDMTGLNVRHLGSAEGQSPVMITRTGVYVSHFVDTDDYVLILAAPHVRLPDRALVASTLERDDFISGWLALSQGGDESAGDR